MKIADYPEYHIALNKFTVANRGNNLGEVKRRLRRYWHVAALLHRRMGNAADNTPEHEPKVLMFLTSST